MEKDKIFDAHIHFNDDYKYKEIDIHEFIKQAQQENVGGFYVLVLMLNLQKKAIELSKQYSGLIYAGIAIHPNEVSKTDIRVLEELDQLAYEKEVIAIGETGLDYFYTKENQQLQKEFFIKHIEIAQKHNKVLQIHIRDYVDVYEAYDDVIEILKKHKHDKIIIHCFSANKEYAEKFIDLNCYINIGGAVTFKNAKTLQEAVEYIPLDKILFETDAPYLTPHPFRGQLNHPKYINLTVEKVAEIKNLSKEEMIKISTNNAKIIFNI